MPWFLVSQFLDHVQCGHSFLPCERIPMTGGVSVSRNDTKCEYTIMFSQIYLSQERLKALHHSKYAQTPQMPRGFTDTQVRKWMAWQHPEAVLMFLYFRKWINKSIRLIHVGIVATKISTRITHVKTKVHVHHMWYRRMKEAWVICLTSPPWWNYGE